MYINTIYIYKSKIIQHPFLLHDKYKLVVNDDMILKNDPSLDEIYKESFIIRNLNIFGIDASNSCITQNHILAKSKVDNKWNLFPENNNDTNNLIDINKFNQHTKLINEHTKYGKLFHEYHIEYDTFNIPSIRDIIESNKDDISNYNFEEFCNFFEQANS